MEKDTINSIPFLNKDNINELFEAGFTTINSIQQSTPWLHKGTVPCVGRKE